MEDADFAAVSEGIWSLRFSGLVGATGTGAPEGTVDEYPIPVSVLYVV